MLDRHKAVCPALPARNCGGASGPCKLSRATSHSPLCSRGAARNFWVAPEIAAVTVLLQGHSRPPPRTIASDTTLPPYQPRRYSYCLCQTLASSRDSTSPTASSTTPPTTTTTSSPRQSPARARHRRQDVLLQLPFLRGEVSRDRLFRHGQRKTGRQAMRSHARAATAGPARLTPHARLPTWAPTSSCSSTTTSTA